MNSIFNKISSFIFNKLIITLICCALHLTLATNISKASNYFSTGNQEYSYNIFTSNTLELSPYLFLGYSFEWVPYNNDVNGMDYKSMLRNRHNGVIGGVGITLNKHWNVGISYSNVKKTSKLRGSFIDKYPSVESIDSEVNMFNIDVAMRLPFSMFYDKTNVYILSGINVVYTTLHKNFYSSTTSVPVNLANSDNKTALGANVGIGVSYNIIGGLFVRLEGRRMFILTKKSSNIKDSWIFNAVVGVNF